MEIKGKVHCFFEQSGTFKREFLKLGIPAADYDIQNEFGETDFVMDLFKEIEHGYSGAPSVFDSIGKDDLILAFFPCIYFSCVSALNFSLNSQIYRGLSIAELGAKIIERAQNRERFFILLNKLVIATQARGLRLVFENPWWENTYLKSGFLAPPSVVDTDRTRRGDCRTKPTGYWFFGCEPTHGETHSPYRGEKKTHMTAASRFDGENGICNGERSTITPTYARNFICDFILGRPSSCGAAQQGDLFG